MQKKIYVEAVLQLANGQAPTGATEEVENLPGAGLCCIPLRDTPRYMLAQGIALIDGDTVRVSRVGGQLRPASIRIASAAPATQQAEVEDCRRCHGSGEDPEGYYDQSRGDAGETCGQPLQDCDGTGENCPALPTAQAADPDGEAFRTAARLGLTLRFYGGCAGQHAGHAKRL